MKNICSLFVVVFLMLFASCVNAKEEVSSTQGVKIDSAIYKTVNKQAKNEAKSMKREKKAKSKYLRNISKIKKLKEKKRIKERDLEFFNSRLNKQKRNLEELTQTREKGEEE